MASSSANEEWFDVVDEADRVIGRETRTIVHQKKLLHRAVHIFVYRPSGELYLQKRSPIKDTAPNKWVSSCSGHVDSGEDYGTAARRELGEELGIPGDSVYLKEVRAVSAVPETGHEFVQLYHMADFTGEISPDPIEIAEGCWKSPAEIDRWIERAPEEFSLSFLYLWKGGRC